MVNGHIVVLRNQELQVKTPLLSSGKEEMKALCGGTRDLGCVDHRDI